MIISDRLFQELIEKTHRRTFNPKTSKQTARELIELDYKQLEKKLAKKRLLHITSPIERYHSTPL